MAYRTRGAAYAVVTVLWVVVDLNCSPTWKSSNQGHEFMGRCYYCRKTILCHKMPRNRATPEQIEANRAALFGNLQRAILTPLYHLDKAVGLDPANNPQYGGFKPDSEKTPLELRQQYMDQVPGPVRDMDMDAPVPGLTYDPVYQGGRYVDPAAGRQMSGGAPRPAYKQYETTPAGQYERYFKTPEFDYVFGSGARGEGAPKDAAAMQALGSQLKADPESRNIASMYAAQSAMGRVNQDAIQKMYEGDKNMQEWARANPMLAQREYLKAEQSRAAGMPLALDQETNMGELGSRAQGVGGYAIETVAQPAAKDSESAKAKLLQRALTRRVLDDQDFPASAPRIPF